jgi:ribosomal protein L6P/L9E
MSRVAKAIVTIPAGVDVSINAETIKVKGKGGDLSLALNGLVTIGNNDGKLSLLPPTTPVKLTPGRYHPPAGQQHGQGRD